MDRQTISGMYGLCLSNSLPLLNYGLCRKYFLTVMIAIICRALCMCEALRPMLYRHYFYLILMITLLVGTHRFSSRKHWAPNPSWSSREAHPTCLEAACKMKELHSSFPILTVFKWLKMWSIDESFFNVWVHHRPVSMEYIVSMEQRERDRGRGREGETLEREKETVGEKGRKRTYDWQKKMSFCVCDRKSDFLIF